MDRKDAFVRDLRTAPDLRSPTKTSSSVVVLLSKLRIKRGTTESAVSEVIKKGG